MRIQFSVEGGIASFPGLSRPITIDTASLPPAEARQLEALVHSAHVFQLPAQVGTVGGGKADVRTFTISVTEGDRTNTIRVIEPITDTALQALIAALQAKQRSG